MSTSKDALGPKKVFPEKQLASLERIPSTWSIDKLIVDNDQHRRKDMDTMRLMGVDFLRSVTSEKRSPLLNYYCQPENT